MSLWKKEVESSSFPLLIRKIMVLTNKFIGRLESKGILDPSLVFLFAIIIRGLYLFEFYQNPFFDLIPPAFDQYCFDKAAEQIASGNIFGPFYSEKYSATYFYFLGIIYSIFGRNFIIIYGIQFLIGAISCVLLYAVSKKLFSRNIALIASLYYALYGPIIFHEGKLLRESLFVFLVIASFHSILQFCERNNYAGAFSAALFSSLAMQTRPNSVFLIPFIFYYIYTALSPLLKTKKGPFVAYFSFFFLISAPLLIRSYVINHRFIFYDDSGALALALANLHDYGGWGWGYTPIFQKFLDTGEQSLKGTLLYILDNLSSSPLNFLYLYLRKLFFVCNGWEIPSNVSYYIYRDFSSVLSLPISNFSIPFSFGIGGMILNVRNYKKLKLLYFFIAGLFLSIIFVWINARFRLPLAPFLIIFSASAVAEIIKGIKLRDSKIYGYSMIILILLIFSNFPIGRDKIRPNDYGNTALAYLENPRLENLSLAEKYLEKAGSEKLVRQGYSPDYYVNINMFLADFHQKQGRIDRVYEIYERTKRMLPFDPKIEEAMGKLSFKRGDYSRSIIHYKRAIELNPENFSYHNELGIAYGNSGNIEEAISEFIKAININPAEPDAYYNLAKAYSFKGMNKEADEILRKGDALRR